MFTSILGSVSLRYGIASGVESTRDMAYIILTRRWVRGRLHGMAVGRTPGPNRYLRLSSYARMKVLSFALLNS